MERGLGAAVSLANIEKAQSFSMGDRTALLTESKRGRGAVITGDGTVLRSRVLGVDLPDLGPSGPPLAAVAFGGRFLARLTGTTVMELIDALTLEPAATVHVLKLADGFGWVVHTPDGYWDASQGAAPYVAVFHGVRPAEAQSRRIEALLQERLSR